MKRLEMLSKLLLLGLVFGESVYLVTESDNSDFDGKGLTTYNELSNYRYLHLTDGLGEKFDDNAFSGEPLSEVVYENDALTDTTRYNVTLGPSSESVTISIGGSTPLTIVDGYLSVNGSSSGFYATLNPGYEPYTYTKPQLTYFSGNSTVKGKSSAVKIKAQAVKYDKNGTYINYNENPLGPCKAAQDAITEMIAFSGRYQYDLDAKLSKTIAESFNLTSDYIQTYPGSGWVLQLAPQAFTSANKSLVVADPGYQQAQEMTYSLGNPVHLVPLLKNGSHDIQKMTSYSDAGLIYICNPNNPTGTITPRETIIQALENKPHGAMVLVDEAYIHFSDVPTVIDLIKKYPDLLVTRTFSKIYGMAGIRAGFVLGHPDALSKISAKGADQISVTTIAATLASLNQTDLVPNRKQYIGSVRDDTIKWLGKHGVNCTDSQANFFMMQTGQNATKVADAFEKQGVTVGRVWDSWPTWLRISVGTYEDMEAFKNAFLAIQNSTISTSSSLKRRWLP